MNIKKDDQVKVRLNRVIGGTRSVQIRRGVVNGPIAGVSGSWWVTLEGEHHARAFGEELIEALTPKEAAQARKLGSPELPHGMPED